MVSTIIANTGTLIAGPYLGGGGGGGGGGGCPPELDTPLLYSQTSFIILTYSIALKRTIYTQNANAHA